MATVSILVVVDLAHRHVATPSAIATAIWVSILVVVDLADRLGRTCGGRSADSMFQSLLSWIWLDRLCQSPGPCRRCSGFNPCCRGSGSPASPRPDYASRCSRVSILVVVDLADRHQVPRVREIICYGVSILVVVDLAHRQDRGVWYAAAREMFQSLLSWIWLTGIAERTDWRWSPLECLADLKAMEDEDQESTQPSTKKHSKRTAA